MIVQGFPVDDCFTYGVASQAMGDTAKNFDVAFVLAVGDNFYDDGVKSVTDHRFQDTFEKVYTAKSLQVPRPRALCFDL